MIRDQNLYTDVYSHDVVSKLIHKSGGKRVVHTIFRVLKSAHVDRQDAHSYRFDGYIITTCVVRANIQVVSAVFYPNRCADCREYLSLSVATILSHSVKLHGAYYTNSICASATQQYQQLCSQRADV